jgi:hypothetical protein
VNYLPHHQPHISESEKDQNLEINRIVGYKRHLPRIIQFVCKWEGYSNEDNMWRVADAFNIFSYGIDFVKKYIFNFSEYSTELQNWIEKMDWTREDIEGTTLSVVGD